MKKLIIISIILLNIFFTKAQKYTPFNLKDGIWLEIEYKKYGLYGQPTNYYYTYYSEGNVLVNNIIYYKFYYELLPIPSLGPAQSPVNIYWGLIRNDTLNKQIKVIKSEDTIETILYDFNLNIGDKLYNFNKDSIIVTFIDSVEICNKYYKRFNTSNNNYFCGFNLKYTDSSKIALIEGIGFNCGLTEPFFRCGEYYKGVVCYSERSNYYCEKPEYWPVSIKTQPTSTNKTKIFYNHLLQELEVTGTEKIKSIKIVSVSGKTIYDWNLCKNNSSLSLTSLRKGIYIVRCYFTNGDVENKKIAVF